MVMQQGQTTPPSGQGVPLPVSCSQNTHVPGSPVPLTVLSCRHFISLPPVVIQTTQHAVDSLFVIGGMAVYTGREYNCD